MTFQLRLIWVLSIAVCGNAFAQRSFDVDIISETFGFDESTKKSVALGDLKQGCPARDCIPSIDNPGFVSAEDADHIADDSIVLTIAYKGEYRAYPARVLDHHEIVNDVIASTPIAITWCPLCGSAVGIHREIAGQVTGFGVSGLLYNSDLVFYDRATETLWDQIGVTGIVGPLTGERLRLVPVSMTRWSTWRAAHPDTLVLSADTGFEVDYSADHYAKYRDTTDLWFPVAETDDRVHAKTVIYGFDFDTHSVAYPHELLARHGTYRHDLNGEQVSVKLHNDGSVTMDKAGEQYKPVRVYWFAWFTFHPGTELIL